MYYDIFSITSVHIPFVRELTVVTVVTIYCTNTAMFCVLNTSLYHSARYHVDVNVHYLGPSKGYLNTVKLLI